MSQYFMSLHTQLREELKDAMRARNELHTTLLRSLLSAFTNELVATKRKPDEELPDEDAFSVVRRAAKQRQDSIKQYRMGKREDLAKREEQELKLIEAYLPQMMSREEIEKAVRAKKEALGIIDVSQKGKLMGAVMAELKGKADGSDVKATVDSLLA